MKLRKGMQAIDFTINDIYGKEIKLSNFKGKKIILGFFRNVSCPFCNLRVHELKKLCDTIREKNIQMIFLFESKPQILKASIFHSEVSPDPLIGDPEKLIYNLYGIENSFLKTNLTFFKAGTFAEFKAGRALNLPEDKDASINLIPADFLIDENFNIVTAHYGSNLRDHIPMSEIKSFVGLQNI